MNLKVKVKYSIPLLREVYYKFLIKQLGIPTIIAMFLLLSVSGYLLFIKDLTWGTGVIHGLTVLLWMIIVFLFVGYRRRIRYFAERMPSLSAEFEFNDESISSETEIGRSVIKWTNIIKLLKHEKAWLLFVDKHVFTTFPVLNVDKEVLDFIEKKVNEHNIEVGSF